MTSIAWQPSAERGLVAATPRPVQSLSQITQNYAASYASATAKTAPLPRKAAEQILRTFVRKAYRRPVETADVTPLLALYDRAASAATPLKSA